MKMMENTPMGILASRARLSILLLLLAGCGGGDPEPVDESSAPPPVISCTVVPRPPACI